jgi:hypothetical protein
MASIRSHYTTKLAPRQSIVFPHVKCYLGGIIPSNDKVTGGAMSSEDRMTIDEWMSFISLSPQMCFQILLRPMWVTLLG